MNRRSTVSGGILQRTLLTVMVPLLAVILALGYHFTNANIRDAREALNARGAFMAEHLAIQSEFSLYTENIEQLHNISNTLLSEPDVALVSINNVLGGTLVNLADENRLYEKKNLVAYTAPIVRTGITVSDFEEETEDNHFSGDNILGKVSIVLSDAAVIEQQKEILFIGTIITLLGLLLGSMLALYVARSVSAPITRLTHDVEKLTGGDLGARTPETSPGELGILEHGINQMAETLQGSHTRMKHEVEQATSALQHTVFQLEQRNAELDRAREEALRAGEAKSAFLARMSHEIRTPLSAVIGFSRLLEQTPQSDIQSEYTRTITQAAAQLLLIIDDILDFSRIESESLAVENYTFDLYESLENMISILCTSAHDKLLELVLLIHSDVPRYICSDASRINQILTNLVSNAIKFTNKGHVVVSVSLREVRDECITLEFSVSDTGIGIDASHLTHIFDPFTQADVTTNRKYGGTGLGLSITKRLARLLEGSVSVSSTPGKGSTFTCILPVIRASSKHRHRKPLLGHRVLVHDSNPFALRALRNRFFTWGASVFNTADRKRMLLMLTDEAEQDYELVVIGLPVSGSAVEQANEFFRAVRNVSPVPLIFLTSSQPQDLQTDSFGDERIQITTKPPRSDRMLRSVMKLLDISDTDMTPEAADRSSETTHLPSFSGMRVLIAEDNSYIQEFLNYILERYDISPAIASNGKEAYHIAGAEKFDIIFMDIHMPVMGGMEAVRKIRDGLNRHTPIIALTADVFSDAQESPEDSELNGCLHKPVNEKELVETLLKWRKGNIKKSSTDTNLTATGRTALADSARKTADLMPAGLNLKLQQELNNQVSAIQHACDDDSQEAMLDHIHQLKGIIEYFGLDDLSDAFKELSHSASNGDRSGIILAIHRLETILASQTGNASPG